MEWSEKNKWVKINFSLTFEVKEEIKYFVACVAELSIFRTFICIHMKFTLKSESQSSRFLHFSFCLFLSHSSFAQQSEAVAAAFLARGRRIIFAKTCFSLSFVCAIFA
jgi:hypothetical protein